MYLSAVLVSIPQDIGYGVTANIAASHAAARGSIPRIRIIFFLQSIITAPCSFKRVTRPAQESSENAFLIAQSSKEYAHTAYRYGYSSSNIYISL